MITVIAKLPIKEGKVEEVSGVFKTLMLNVAKEEGTLLYSLNKEKSKPNTLVVVEQYKDLEAFKFHSSTNYFKEFFAKINPSIDGKPDIAVM